MCQLSTLFAETVGRISELSGITKRYFMKETLTNRIYNFYSLSYFLKVQTIKKK